MAEPIGATASIVGLISTAITLVEQVQNARKCVKGRPKVMRNVAKQLKDLSQSLALVKEEKRIQTPCVKGQVKAVIEVAEELKKYFHDLESRQKRDPILAFFHALKAGNSEEKELDNILARLGSAKDELLFRISVTNVGLVGNIDDGFRVVRDVLTETNDHVKKLVARDLELMDCVRGRQTEEDGTVLLDSNDEEKLNLHDQESLLVWQMISVSGMPANRPAGSNTTLCNSS
jgi:hypothetical protein